MPNSLPNYKLINKF